ncbi:transmembrane 220 family protein [Emticicia sp. SJ17W-69]|uniref:transmembrane 220 family protein n=1 Tax=Emticicia sp. SJ17W-69 TaxID=3421657 RepID=UPI003EBC76A2
MIQKVVLWFFIIVFLYFTGVQYNDPDPYVWIPTYLIPVFLCYYKLQGKGEKVMYFTVGLLFLMWAINQFPPAWEGVLLNQLGMKTLNIELGRESLGLGCCTIAMWVCAALKN